MHHIKSATCCYCGSRTTLQLSGKTRHELACGSCGAPLSKLKMLPSAGKTGAGDHHVLLQPAASKLAQKAQKQHPKKYKKKKKNKSFKRKAWGEIWDVIEDIFD